MSESQPRPRFPRVEIATDEDLRRGLRHTLNTLGYRFNQEVNYGSGSIDFEVFDDQQNTTIIVTVTAGTADEGIVATALKHLGWYRNHQGKPDTQAWLIANKYTSGAVYAAHVCPDLTLKSYEVEISLADGWTYRA